jgi:hypothetical protein
MQVFFDTEFSSLNKKDGHRYLISVGCVAQDGREFYAELTDTWDQNLCSIFTIETVLPLLQGGEYEMGVTEMAARLKTWIEGLTEKEVTLRSDAPIYDWPFIQEIFDHEGWPKNLKKKCGTIYFEENRQKHRFIAGLENYWKTNLSRQHHALVDAKSLLFAWKFAMKKGM